MMIITNDKKEYSYVVDGIYYCTQWETPGRPERRYSFKVMWMMHGQIHIF